YLVYVLIKFTDPEHRVLYIICMIMLFLGVNFLTWEHRKVFWLILALIASGNLHKETPSLAPSRRPVKKSAYAGFSHSIVELYGNNEWKE
ncbi:hypothetical protein, partial [Geobacillus thermoleovorans]